MTAMFSTDSKLYQFPPEFVLKNRREFYLSQKENTESISEWLYRIGKCIKDCDFGAISNFLLIDKFFCELSDEDIRKFQNDATWSLEQLLDEQQTHPKDESSSPIDDILEINVNDVS